MSRISVVGLISDTHGLLRQKAFDALQGCDLIIHAGDVGSAQVLERLNMLAAVTAVRGNVDKGEWATELPLTATVKAGPARIYVLHDVKELDIDPAGSKLNVVISGHSHKPGTTDRSGVLYVNPGSAGPRRFRLPVTIARLNLSHTPWGVDFVDLLAE